MRTTRIYTPIYIALLFAAIGCDKNYDQPATGQNDIVMFAASLAGTADGADSGSTPQTKGELLNTGTTDISLPSGITEFNVAAYDGTTRFIPATNATNGYEPVTYSNSKWATQTTYFWPGSGSKTFYAYANMPDDLNTNGGPSISCTSTGQVLTGFTINTDYTAQQDILMGYYSGNGKGASAVARTAAIKFYHPLTAIRFKMGTATGVTINSLKSIKISDIYSSGTVTQAENSFVWSSFGDATSITMSNTALVVDGTTKLISNTAGGDNTFILIPQNLATKNVTVEITANTTEGDKTFTGTLSTGAWEAGKIYVYEANFSGEIITFSSISVDNWNATSAVLPTKMTPEDALPGLFSVSPTKKVHFSKGNLYCERGGTAPNYTYTFHFEDKQYNCRARGLNNDEKGEDFYVEYEYYIPADVNSFIGGEYTGAPENTSGLFQWAHTNCVPGGDYGAFSKYDDSECDEMISYVPLDFGSAIGSGLWHTLSLSEWAYLLGFEGTDCYTPGSSSGRDNASDLYKYTTITFDSSGESEEGLVIAPDDYNYNTNPLLGEYSEDDWEDAENDGLVFLPFAGWLDGSSGGGFYDSCQDIFRYLWLWTASPAAYNMSWILQIGLDDDDVELSEIIYTPHTTGASVRLVCY